MWPIRIIFLTLAVMSCSPEIGDEEKYITKLDQRFPMPLGAFSRYQYDGYFVKSGRRYSITYIHATKVRKLYLVKPQDVPKVFDGGCSVVNGVFDIDKNIFVNVHCNGVS